MSEPAPSSKPELTPFEKLKVFTAQVLSVSKSEIDRRDAEWQKQQAEKRSIHKNK